MRAATSLLLAAATAAVIAPSAHADTNRDELWIGGGTRTLASASANALTSDNLSGTSLGLARDLDIAVLPRMTVWAEAGLTTGDANGVMFQSLFTEISALGLTGGLRARYQLHRLIAASARLDLGAQRASLAISDHAGSSASDHGWGAMAQASASLDLFAVARPPFGIGLRAELGYVIAQAISLTAHRDASSDTLMLPMTEVGLGHLDLSGPTFALSLVGQF
jgi:hypothetical protein